MKVKKYQKKAIIFGITLLFGIFLLTLASAEFWACFERGQAINYCNPKTPDRVCRNGVCLYCMSSRNQTGNCYNQGNFNACNNIAPTCTEMNGTEQGIDAEPPVLTILNPTEGGIYSAKSVLVNILSSERADIFYRDNDRRTPRPTRLCRNCMSYEKKQNFNEGENNITFIGIDATGNNVSYNINFLIDSKKPKILNVFPKRGFTSGDFNLKFKEENPVSLYFYYGNIDSGFLSHQLAINNDCSNEEEKYSCETNVDLSQFNNNEISYWFNVTDIAGSSDANKPVELQVDTTPPIIDYLNYTIRTNHLNLEMKVTEENFDLISYMDNSAPEPKWKTLCASLNKEGICRKQITLEKGDHDIDIQVKDKGGNIAAQNLDVVIN